MKPQTVIRQTLTPPLVYFLVYIFNTTGPEIVSEQHIAISISAPTTESVLFHSQEELDQTVPAVQPHSVGAEGHVSRGKFPRRHLQGDQDRGRGLLEAFIWQQVSQQARETFVLFRVGAFSVNS